MKSLLFELEMEDYCRTAISRHAAKAINHLYTIATNLGLHSHIPNQDALVVAIHDEAVRKVKLVAAHYLENPGRYLVPSKPGRPMTEKELRNGYRGIELGCAGWLQIVVDEAIKALQAIVTIDEFMEGKRCGVYREAPTPRRNADRLVG